MPHDGSRERSQFGDERPLIHLPLHDVAGPTGCDDVVEIEVVAVDEPRFRRAMVQMKAQGAPAVLEYLPRGPGSSTGRCNHRDSARPHDGDARATRRSCWPCVRGPVRRGWAQRVFVQAGVADRAGGQLSRRVRPARRAGFGVGPPTVGRGGLVWPSHPAGGCGPPPGHLQIIGVPADGVGPAGTAHAGLGRGSMAESQACWAVLKGGG
jgi:hypothetical protein